MRGNVDAVGDEIGKKPILGELGEDGVVELVHRLRHAIAEMRREGKASLHRLSNHLSLRGAVAHRNDLATRLCPADELERAFDLGRERDEKDRPPEPRFQPLDKSRVGGRHRLMRVTAAVTVGGVQERPFEMIPGHMMGPRRPVMTARSSALKRPSSVSGSAVIKVGRQSVTPVERIRFNARSSISGVIASSLKSIPAKPLT